MTQILVVEDEQRVAELLKRGLEECGYLVTVAFDGEMGRVWRKPVRMIWLYRM